MANTGLYKTCKRCGRTLFIDGFPKDRSTSDGLYYLCRECAYDKYQEYMSKKVPETLMIDGLSYTKVMGGGVRTININGMTYAATEDL